MLSHEDVVDHVIFPFEGEAERWEVAWSENIGAPES